MSLSTFKIPISVSKEVKCHDYTVFTTIHLLTSVLFVSFLFEDKGKKFVADKKNTSINSKIPREWHFWLWYQSNGIISAVINIIISQLPNDHECPPLPPSLSALFFMNYINHLLWIEGSKLIIISVLSDIPKQLFSFVKFYVACPRRKMFFPSKVYNL